MADADDGLQNLYRAVSRKQGRAIAYAGCVTAPEARQLASLGLARLVDIRIVGGSDFPQAGFVEALHRVARPDETMVFVSATPESSHAAATVAAKAGFHGVLNALDGRGCFEHVDRRRTLYANSMCSPGAELTARSTNSRFSGDANVSMKS